MGVPVGMSEAGRPIIQSERRCFVDELVVLFQMVEIDISTFVKRWKLKNIVPRL